MNATTKYDSLDLIVFFKSFCFFSKSSAKVGGAAYTQVFMVTVYNNKKNIHLLHLHTAVVMYSIILYVATGKGQLNWSEFKVHLSRLGILTESQNY